MMRNNHLKLLVVIALFLPIQFVVAHPNDDPVLTKLTIDQLESRDNKEGNVNIFEGQFWLGQDLQKLWFKADVEQHKGETEEFELQALYSKAIAPYWDLQFGVRQDFKTNPQNSWAVIGVQGLAPYYFEVDAALFIGEEGRTAARLSAEYEMMFTQRWALSPEIEANFYGQDDINSGTGSGLSNIQLGLRLRYEIRREFAPYIGVNGSKKFGGSADFARAAGKDIDELQWVVGVHAWF